MRLLHAIAPIALLSTAACELPDVFTPADYADDAVPVAPRALMLPSAEAAIAAWQLPAESPWSRYEKLTLLTYLSDQPVAATMPDVASFDEVLRAKNAAVHVASAGLPAGALWVVDLYGAASVAFGATLSQMAKTPVAPVMTFNNWPAEDEVIPSEQALTALVTMRPRLPKPEEVSATPVFLLDAYRLSAPYVEPDPAAIDNRYMLFPADFPDAATLRARGITKVIYVVGSRTERSVEEDDFHDVATAYQADGIELCLVDLADLQQLGAAEPWDGELLSRRLVITARVTILSDPVFYSRARGGFGGVHAAPAPAGAPRAYIPAHPTVSGGHSSGERAYSSASPHVAGHSGGGRAYSSVSPHVGGHGGG